MRKAPPLQRASLLALALGLALIIQPWSHALFAAGFPFALAALAVHTVAGWRAGDRAGRGSAASPPARTGDKG